VGLGTHGLVIVGACLGGKWLHGACCASAPYISFMISSRSPAHTEPLLYCIGDAAQPSFFRKAMLLAPWPAAGPNGSWQLLSWSKLLGLESVFGLLQQVSRQTERVCCSTLPRLSVLSVRALFTSCPAATSRACSFTEPPSPLPLPSP